MKGILATYFFLAAIITIRGKIIDNELVEKLTRNYNLNNNLNRISSENEKAPETTQTKNVAGLMQNVLCRHFPTIPCKLIMEDKTLRTLIQKTVKQIKSKSYNTNIKGLNERYRKVYQKDNDGSNNGQINDEDLSNFLAVKHTGFFVDTDKQKAFKKKKKHTTAHKTQSNKHRTKYDTSIEKYHKKVNYLEGDRPSKSVEALVGVDYSKVYSIGIPNQQDWWQNNGARRDTLNNYLDRNPRNNEEINNYIDPNQWKREESNYYPNHRKNDDIKDKKMVKSYRKDVLRPDLYIKKKFARMNGVNNKSFDFDTAEDKCKSYSKTIKLAGSWWREPKLEDEECGDASRRLWRLACNTLVAPGADTAWTHVVEATPKDTFWHSLGNCISHQAEVWQGLLSKGMDDVIQPAAFKLAIVMRHAPTDITARLLAELLRLHPQSQDLISYILALLTDDEAGCGQCMAAQAASGENSPVSPAPLRDLQLFGDCELSILGAPPAKYEAHAKLVRAEYSKLTAKGYLELRIRILNQLAQVPKLYHTPEFEHFDKPARENIEREIQQLREELLTNHGRK